MTIEAVDQKTREQALNLAHSFIVQAPAGSGKTQLLTQRFLALLTIVKEPEEIIAITFTRKAASEMKARIINALRAASQEKSSETVAARALKRDQEQGWQLSENPQRLRVMTIDALCLKLAQRSPILSGISYQTAISENADAFYQEAVEAILAELDEDSPLSDAIETLLSHLDNRLDTLSSLLGYMLSCREQWLPLIIQTKNKESLRQWLEENLQNRFSQLSQAVSNALPAHLKEDLERLYRFASEYSNEIAEKGFFQSLPSFLLTTEHEFRKEANKYNGFPAPSGTKDKAEKALYQHQKDSMKALLAELPLYPEFKQALINLAHAPDLHYTEAQWEVLAALLTLLPIIAAQLQIIFKEKNTVDFTETNLAALRALGNQESPSDLALLLDYQLNHLLIDEFQDTSILQFNFLLALTAGWHQNDGKTVFLVGDPMQSIYRFRQAEVGLFLKAKEEGIGSIPLHYLQLKSNFRSDPLIIEWVNQIFETLFPAFENKRIGAIAYAASIAANEKNTAALVKTHLIAAEPHQDFQTQVLTELLQELHQKPNNKSIAILVRSRSHLKNILPRLREAQIPFSAVEIEHFHEQRVIQDLLNLTYAITHLADRTAWIGFLRAPFCGFSLIELSDLIEREDKNELIWDCLQKASEDFKNKPHFLKTTRILAAWWKARYQKPLHLMVEGIWQGLGGPICYQESAVITQSRAFFDLLAAHEAAGTLLDRAAFESALASLYVETPSQESTRLQIMTLHKAKGLEFDIVILPYLEKTPAKDTDPLLRFEHYQADNLSEQLLLAPIHAAHNGKEITYQHLKQQEQLKQDLEVRRLLYVGVTRAKEALHLMGSVECDEDNSLKLPVENSLLSRFFPFFDKNTLIKPSKNPSKTTSTAVLENRLMRLAELEEI
ncbi:MAG: UvrD/REP helicase [Gammaproteobacteria bacterium]|nr:UvrD/REP helicase [Gammaproteobacteria bacterium]